MKLFAKMLIDFLACGWAFVHVMPGQPIAVQPDEIVPDTVEHVITPPNDKDNAGQDAARRDEDEAVALLRRLEARHADVRTLAADLTYQTWDAVLERTETRLGRLAYDIAPEEVNRRFAVEFLELARGQVRIEERRRYVFSGSWLAEYNYPSRMFIKRQIVPPDEIFDPLKLGEGPFPMPFGQPVDEVLARFEVELIGPPDSGLLAGRLGDVYGLALTPLAETAEAKEFSRVELYYDQSTLLPVGVIAFGSEEVGEDTARGLRNRTTVWLRNVQAGVEIEEEMLTIETPDRTQWDIDIRAWEQ